MEQLPTSITQPEKRSSIFILKIMTIFSHLQPSMFPLLLAKNSNSCNYEKKYNCNIFKQGHYKEGLLLIASLMIFRIRSLSSSTKVNLGALTYSVPMPVCLAASLIY